MQRNPVGDPWSSWAAASAIDGHSDGIYRLVLTLLLTGSMGHNGDGWGHYIG
nr:hypothetical protein [Mycobacterium lepromatosis]